jgi:hypothetical protein
VGRGRGASEGGGVGLGVGGDGIPSPSIHLVASARMDARLPYACRAYFVRPRTWVARFKGDAV